MCERWRRREGRACGSSCIQCRCMVHSQSEHQRDTAYRLTHRGFISALSPPPSLSRAQDVRIHIHDTQLYHVGLLARRSGEHTTLRDTDRHIACDATWRLEDAPTRCDMLHAPLQQPHLPSDISLRYSCILGTQCECPVSGYIWYAVPAAAPVVL